MPQKQENYGIVYVLTNPAMQYKLWKIGRVPRATTLQYGNRIIYVVGLPRAPRLYGCASTQQ